MRCNDDGCTRPQKARLGQSRTGEGGAAACCAGWDATTNAELPPNQSVTRPVTREICMKNFILAGAAAFLLITPVYAQSIPEKTGVDSTLGISPSTQDFVTEAAESDMLEIESSRLALAKADEKSKAFATKMITDHTQTSTELKGLVTGGKVKAFL